MPSVQRIKRIIDVRICMFGAAGDSGNLGVSALLYASLTGLSRREPGAKMTVFDNGWGVRDTSITTDAGDFQYSLCGARASRRYYRPESFWLMQMSSYLGGLGNPGMRAIMEASAVWDISGGDSFTDLYGKKRFDAIVKPKEICLAAGTDLILLPQTYGPLRTQRQSKARCEPRQAKPHGLGPGCRQLPHSAGALG